MDRRPDRTAAEQLLADPSSGEATDQVAALLASAGRLEPSEPAPELLARMAATRATTTPHPRRKTMRTTPFVARTAAVAAALTLTATSAAAATGALPDPAQDALARAAERVGFDLPRADDDEELEVVDVADETEDDATTSDDTETDDTETDDTDTDDTEDGTESADPEANDHGQRVSSIARSDFESGREHGEAVSDAARQRGLDQRGEDAPAATEDGGQAGDHGQAPVATPNHGAAGAEAGNPAAEDAPVATPNHGAAASETPAAGRAAARSPKGT